MQYAAKACPEGSIYGSAVAHTPLLDQPLAGPVYLRSSDNNLPDLVFALKGIIDVEAVARIDSKNGGIRASIENTPDAPLSEVIVDMPAGKKGLIVNSTDLCAKKRNRRAALPYVRPELRRLGPPYPGKEVAQTRQATDLCVAQIGAREVLSYSCCSENPMSMPVGAEEPRPTQRLIWCVQPENL